MGQGLVAVRGEHSVTIACKHVEQWQILPGTAHRRHRKMLNSGFTMESMRQVTPVVFNVTGRVRPAAGSGSGSSCCRQLRDTMAYMVKDGAREIDVLHWISRLSLELLAQGGFGHELNLVSSSNAIHPMLRAIKNLM